VCAQGRIEFAVNENAGAEAWCGEFRRQSERAVAKHMTDELRSLFEDKDFAVNESIGNDPLPRMNQTEYFTVAKISGPCM